MIAARKLSLGAFLLASLPVLCAAEEIAVTVGYDEAKKAVVLKADKATYTLTEELPVRILKWFDGKRITVEGVVKDGAFVFRQVSEPKLDATLTGVAYKDGVLPKLRIGTATFKVTGPGLKSVVLATQAGARSITFEAYRLYATDGSPDLVIVKRVQATTKVALFNKGRAGPGATVWILGDAWWGMKAEVLGPGGTRDNTLWGNLTIGEAAEMPRPAQGRSLTDGVEGG